MKKFRKIMAIMVAAVMIVAMAVPAWAATTTGRSVLADGASTGEYGSIIINNAEDGETYNAYRIFDLYSFTDNDITTSQHAKATENYAYVVKASTGTGASDTWYTFIKNNYTSGSNAYFIIDEDNPVTLNGATYYFVTSTTRFDAFGDVANSIDATADEEDRDDAINTVAGTPPTTTYSKVQQFAQAALTWRKSQSFTYDKLTPITGTGTVYTADQPQTGDSGSAANKVTIQWTDIPLGYYLVDSSIGSMVALDTTNKRVEMFDKNANPTLAKYVRVHGKQNIKRDGTNKVYASTAFETEGIWKSNTDYQIGERITFLSRITVPKGAIGGNSAGTGFYKYHDVMEDGFALSATRSSDPEGYSNIRIFSGNNTKMTEVASSNYTLTGAPTNGCDFEITFLDTFINSLFDGAIIEIEYDVDLTKDAYVFGDTAETDLGDNTGIAASRSRSPETLEGGNAAPGIQVGEDDNRILEIPRRRNTDGHNTNSAILTFGLNSATPWAVATVDTYQLDLAKTKEDFDADGTYDLLAEAEFELYEAKKDANGDLVTGSGAGADTTKIINFVKDAASNASQYRVYDNIETPAAGLKVTKIATISGSEINIRGLEKGDYYLKETKAPTGFHLIGGYYKISINGDGTFDYAYINSADEAKTGGTYTGTSVSWNATTSSNAYAAELEGNVANGGFHLVNKTSLELPSTGGMGTTVLYIVGGMLVILAGAYLFFSRKKTA